MLVLGGAWLNCRRARVVANDPAKLIPHVMGRYAELMEKHGGSFMGGPRRRLLPRSFIPLYSRTPP